MNKENSVLGNNLKKIFLSSIIVFIGIALSKIFTYVYRIIIARNFDPAEYGLFSLATITAILAVSLFSLGLPESLVRYISFYRGRKDFKSLSFLVKYTTLFLIASGIIAFFVLFIFSDKIALGIFHDDRLIPFIKMVAIAVPFYIIANVYLSVLRAFESIKRYSFILNIVQNVGKVVALLLLIFVGLKEDAIMLSYLIGIFAMFLFSAIAVKKYYGKILSEYNLSEKKKEIIVKELFSYSWPLSLLSVASFILYWIDSFSIGYFINAEAVGLYNAAVPLSALIMIAPDLIVQLFFPLVTKEYAKKNNKLIEEMSKQVMKWIFIFNIPVTIVLILFPGAIINFFFGDTYLMAENALRLLAFGSFFGAMSIIPAHLISMIRKSKIMLSNILSMAILNLILNAILVPKYGINGAAFSTMIVMILLAFIYLVQVKMFIGFVPLRRKMMRIAVASLIPLGFVIYIKNFFDISPLILVFLGIIFLLLYLLFILLFKCLDKNDILILDLAKRRFIQKA